MYSELVGVGVGVHQGSVLGSLPFIIVLVASFLGSYTQAANECCCRLNDYCWFPRGTVDGGWAIEFRDGEERSAYERWKIKDISIST